MPINFDVWAKALMGAGERASEHISREFERQRSEQEGTRELAKRSVMEEFLMGRRQSLEDASYEARQARELSDQKALARDRIELEERSKIKMSQYQAKVDSFFGSPEFMGSVTADLASGDGIQKRLAIGKLAAINKLRGNQKLEPEDDRALETIQDPLVQVGLANLRRENQKVNAELMSTAAYAKYMDAIAAKQAASSTGKMDMSDAFRLFQNASDQELQIQGLLNGFMSQKEWLSVSRMVDSEKSKFISKNPQANEQQFMGYLQTVLTPTDMAVYTNGLSGLQALSGALKEWGTIKQGLAPLFIKQNAPAPGVGGPPQQDTAVPGPTQTAPQKTNILSELGYAAKPAVKGLVNVLRPKGDAQSEGKVRGEYGLSKEDKIHFVEDDTELQKFKTMPNAEGSYVFIDGDLFKLTRRQKTLGLVEVKKNKKK